MNTTTALRGRRIAIIGGAGFIGHSLALSLRDAGADVDVIDSLQVNNLLSFASGSGGDNRELYLRIINERLTRLMAAGVPLHPLDARDYQVLGRVLNQLKPQVIVHLAAVSHAGRSNKDPHSTFDHSLRTLENALDCARDSVEQFIYLSSSMVYGHFESEAADENHPQNPIGIYGALKVAGEKLVIAYQQVFDLSYTIIRPSALYGPGCVSRRVSQVFIESAMSGGRLIVDGDGSSRLDFTYIDDLVQGIKLAIQVPAAKNETFNITYGRSRAVSELVQILQQHFPAVGVERVPRDRLTPERGTLTADKARGVLGYSPQFDLETGIGRYIDWYRQLRVGFESVADEPSPA